MTATQAPGPDNVQGNAPSNAWPRKFSWPMRVFLCYFVADMVLRSLFSLLPYGEWREELRVAHYPKALPTPAELRAIRAGENPEHKSPLARFAASLADVPAYLSPIPNAETRSRIEDVQDVGVYAATWLVTRLDFAGNVIGVNQGWPMFSPNTVTGDTLARFRLVYADGSSSIHNSIVDPVDPTSIGHFLDAKLRRSAGRAHEDVDIRLGYCMWLAKQYPANEAASPLREIEVFKVRYEYPGPQDDPHEFLAAQYGPPPSQQQAPFWVYRVASGRGEYIE